MGAKHCTDRRMGLPVVFKQLILPPLRPTTSIHFGCDLSFTLLSFSICKCVQRLLCDPRENDLNRVVVHSYVLNRLVLHTSP